MKIALISSNITTSPYPVYPLGMSMVAAALRRAGHDVCTFDLLHQPEEELTAAVQAEAPDLIGVSIRNIDNVNILNEQRYIPVAQKLVTALRAASSAPIMLGGAGFSILPERILEETGADYGIVGEGERLAVELAAALEAGKPPAVRCLRSPELMPGDAIKTAWYQPELMEKYRASGSLAGIQSKRGCNHHCVYCTYPYLEGHTLRPRNPRDVVDEIEILLRDFATPQYHFTDSVFNDVEGHYIQLLEEMERRNLTAPWTAFFKPGNMDTRIVQLMKRTGLQSVELGTDAATDTTLRRMGKSFSWQDAIVTTDLLLDHGINVAHYVMFGGPGETPETVTEGIAHLKALRKTPVFVFMGIRILPGTPLLALAIKEGILSAEHDLLEPVYYIAPGIERDWLERTLEESFRDIRHIVFPPDAFESTIAMLKKMGGHAGPLWELLMREPRRKRSAPKK